MEAGDVLSSAISQQVSLALCSNGSDSCSVVYASLPLVCNAYHIGKHHLTLSKSRQDHWGMAVHQDLRERRLFVGRRTIRVGN